MATQKIHDIKEPELSFDKRGEITTEIDNRMRETARKIDLDCSALQQVIKSDEQDLHNRVQRGDFSAILHGRIKANYQRLTGLLAAKAALQVGAF